jgi:hypothetical protein
MSARIGKSGKGICIWKGEKDDQELSEWIFKTIHKQDSRC